MIGSKLLLPPLPARMEEGQPVFTREQALNLTRKIMAMSTVEDATVRIRHSVRSITRFANNRIRSTDDGETLSIELRAENRQWLRAVHVQINQLDEASLKHMVTHADTLLKAMILNYEKLAVETSDEQDRYAPTHLWHDSTVKAMRSARETVVPQVVRAVQAQEGVGAPFNASGFVGISARADATLSLDGITAYSNETDSEVSVTARPADGKASGWQGQAARDYTKLDPTSVAVKAADMAARNVNPFAVEPGRRTAILAPGAVIQLMRFLVPHFHGANSDGGLTAFSKVPPQRGSRWEQQMFDKRIQITSDPGDPEGGYLNWFGKGYANTEMIWIDKGRLRNLSYEPIGALSIGKKYSELPFGMRVHSGSTTIEQMIAQCEEGIYVHRVSGVDVIDMNSGMMTGVTSDGCFLIKKGKIDRPIKNFRFYTSPFFFLNQLVAIGPTRRTAFGYAPPTQREMQTTSKWNDFFEWPRWPMIVPPLMVKDFNFSALIDAV